MKNPLSLVKFACLAVALVILFAPAAFAAYTSPSSDSAVSWAGPYAGLDIGATWGDFYKGTSGTGGDISGGGFGGYNWQWGHIVAGGEADISGIGVTAKTGGTSFDEDWNMTFRGRAGYALGRILPYATIGLGITSATWSIAGGNSTTTVRPGIAVGAGADAMISGNWFGRFEYLYTSVPSETVKVGAASFTGGSDNNTLRVGVGYKF